MMYAVKYKLKDVHEWNFASKSIIISESEVMQHKYPPKTYLCEDMSEAREVYLIVIERYKDYLQYIKISKMNKWNNYKTESEVLGEYWREWK